MNKTKRKEWMRFAGLTTPDQVRIDKAKFPSDRGVVRSAGVFLLSPSLLERAGVRFIRDSDKEINKLKFLSKSYKIV